MLKNRKLVTTIFVVAIVVIATLSVAPVVISALMGPGVKTEQLSEVDARPADTDINGQWTITTRPGRNSTGVGYTFHEILPGDQRITSGTTTAVSGDLIITDNTVQSGVVTVDMQHVASDNERRDINVRQKVLETDTYPEATFELTRPISLGSIPADGTAGTATVHGTLTIHGVAKDVTEEFKVLRDGTSLVISGIVPITRSEFNVETPEFIAATIDDAGELNIRLKYTKDQ